MIHITEKCHEMMRGPPQIEDPKPKYNYMSNIIKFQLGGFNFSENVSYLLMAQQQET